MLINDSEFEKRINNPANLMNKDKKTAAMSLFIKPSIEKKEFKVSFPKIEEKKIEKIESIIEEIKTDDILKDADANIKLASVHGKALEIMHKAMGELEIKLPEMKADRLPSVVSSLGRVITDIRKEQTERNRNQKEENVHFHFYCPESKKLEQYEVIDV